MGGASRSAIIFSLDEQGDPPIEKQAIPLLVQIQSLDFSKGNEVKVRTKVTKQNEPRAYRNNDSSEAYSNTTNHPLTLNAYDIPSSLL